MARLPATTPRLRQRTRRTRAPIASPVRRTALCATLIGVLAATLSPLASRAEDASGRCEAASAPTGTTLVELYTSEGCNSCPPADRWLSREAAQAGVVALAFHVDYWDRLGWKDPFGSRAHTERQSAQQRVNGARFSYTPQVVVNGVDTPAWPGVRLSGAAAGVAAAVQIRIERDGDRYLATVQPVDPPAGAAPRPARLAAYWAVTEDGHVSAVRAGENAGVTLAHDRVVRELQPVPAWSPAPDRPHALAFTPHTATDTKHLRRINLVVVDDTTGRPVQALALGC